MLRRAAQHQVSGHCFISSYQADARASSHVNLEIVTCATGIEGAYRFRDAAAQQGAKKRTAKSPAQQMLRRSLSSAARTSAGSFSKFRRAMSMRSSESPLAGGDE